MFNLAKSVNVFPLHSACVFRQIVHTIPGGFDMSHFIASFMFTGYIRPAPGTWGTLAALLVVIIMHWFGGPFAVCLFFIGVTLLGLWAVRNESDEEWDWDPSWVVIDEAAGITLALIPVSFGSAIMRAEITSLWPGLLAGFIFFRLFDIWKPWVIGRADAAGGPWSIMEDDLWAGLFAAGCVIIAAAGAHIALVI